MARRAAAEGMRQAGYNVLNHLFLNQVLVSFGEPEYTRRVIATLQADGTCWCGGTVWPGSYTPLRSQTVVPGRFSLQRALRCERSQAPSPPPL
mgnify:CR=1 FL=1